MIWGEFNYNNEKAHQCDRRNDCDGQRPSDPVEINTELFNHYKQLNKLKSQYNVLNYGDYKTVYTDQNGLYIFSRSYDDQTILAIFNGAKHSTEIPSSIWGKTKTDWTSLIGKANQNNIKGKSGHIFIHEN
jgi:glycosidase